MSKSPLVPTPIVNKNGVATTVHKRAHSPNDRLRNLPAPVAPFSVAKEALHRVNEAIAKTYERGVFAVHGVSDIESLQCRLQKYTPAVVMAYDQAISDNPDEGYEELLISALNQRVDTDKSGYLLFIAQHDQNQDTKWSYGSNGIYSHENAEARYNGIKSLEHQFGFNIPQSIYETDDIKSIQIISALITAATAVYESKSSEGISYVSAPGDGYTLENYALIELIVKRPEDAQRIADIVIARGNPDTSIIEEVLDSDQQALSDGLL